MSGLTARDVRAAIIALLAALPDDELPTPTKIETDAEGRRWAWFGGTGYGLGTATRGGVRNPGASHDLQAASDALTHEAVRRLDLKEPDRTEVVA